MPAQNLPPTVVEELWRGEVAENSKLKVRVAALVVALKQANANIASLQQEVSTLQSVATDNSKPDEDVTP